MPHTTLPGSIAGPAHLSERVFQAQVVEAAGTYCQFFIEGRAVSVNARTRRTRNGRFYVTREARAWEELVAMSALPYRHLFSNKSVRPLRLQCTLVGGRGDVDNSLKCLLDGLKQGLMIDDHWFNPVGVAREPLRKRRQGVKVEIWAVSARGSQS